MKRRMVCIGLLLCVGCVGEGVLPSPPLSAYSDAELQDLATEKYFECAYAAAAGDEARARWVFDEFIDIYEEMLSRPSVVGYMTEAQSQSMQQYLDLIREYSNGASWVAP